MTQDELLDRYDKWAAERAALFEHEADTGEFLADEVHATEDDAVELLHALVDTIRPVTP
jgi:hypothetical protein